jgi:hypothetical protein
MRQTREGEPVGSSGERKCENHIKTSITEKTSIWAYGNKWADFSCRVSLFGFFRFRIDRYIQPFTAPKGCPVGCPFLLPKTARNSPISPKHSQNICNEKTAEIVVISTAFLWSG